MKCSFESRALPENDAMGQLRWPHLLILLTLVTPGCAPEDGAAPALDSYVDRLENALAVSDEARSTQPEPVPISWYPSRELRTFELDETRLDVASYLRIRWCELDDLVAERNSALGRVMLESTRLVYEHALVVRLEDCLAALEAQPSASDEERGAKMQAEVKALLDAKRESLPRVYWNATLGSRELASFFSRRGEPLPIDGPSMPVDVEHAFGELVAIGAGLGRRDGVSRSRLERANYVLQSRPYGGELLASLALATASLERAIIVLDDAAAGTPCSTPSDAVVDVFRAAYAGGVQPYVASIGAEARRLKVLVEKLSHSTAVEPPPEVALYLEAHFGDEEGSVWSRFSDATTEHAHAWQRLFDVCGIAVEELQPAA